MKQNSDPEINPRICGQFITKDPRMYNGEMTVSSINDVGETATILHHTQS